MSLNNKNYLTLDNCMILTVNKDYDFIGTHSIKIYSVNTAQMNDYGRNTAVGNEEGAVVSRYGLIEDLTNEVQEVSMEKDRSFTFVIDKMDEDETLGALNAGSALARQLREVVMPDNIQRIGENAFYGCSSITLRFKDGVAPAGAPWGASSSAMTITSK